MSEAPTPPSDRGHQVPGAVAVVAAALVLSLVFPDAFSVGLLTTWAVYALAGVGFYLVFGLSGQFAFSQAAFVGLGAYTAAWASRGTGALVGLGAAVAVSAAVALAFSVLVRHSGDFYLAIATLALGSIALVVFREWTAFTAVGGEVSGIPRPGLFGVRLTDDRQVLWVGLALLLAALVLVALIERSPLRRAAVALRDRPEVAAAAGIRTRRLRYQFFVLGSVFAAVAGWLTAHRTGSLSPDAFSLQLGIDLFLVLLLGGVHSMWGPVVGAAFVVWAPEQLRVVGQHRALLYGVLLVVVVLAFPRGLVGLADGVRRRVRSRWGPARGRRGGPDAGSGAGPEEASGAAG